ncbi:MAG: BamA/TamA family outer membrane protein [Balneolales bacterium]|nr:BamA/TamA family outer membrane protein [Balneolales bacterium]
MLAQQNGTEEPEVENLVRSVRFNGNSYFSNGDLERVVRTQTNREIFGIPGATLWLGLYRISSRLGEAPRILNRNTVAQDKERIRLFYNNHGFFSAQVDTTVERIRSRRYRVIFHITEGDPSVIRSVTYRGFPEDMDPRTVERFYSRSPLIREQINDTTYSVNRQYSVDQISVERNRVIELLHNNGYASASRDSIIALIRRDPENPLELDMMMRIRPGPVYTFGDVRINLEAPGISSNGSVRSDTLMGEPFTIEPNRLILNIDEQARTRSRLLQQRVLFKPGERFDNRIYMSTVNQFQTLQMLSVRQFSLTESGGQTDFSQSQLPVYLDLETLPRHQIRSDLFGMQRVGPGAGAGIQYSNNNIFGRAERLEIGLSGSYEYTGQSNFDNPRSFEISTNYSFPRFAYPFTAFNNDRRFLNPRTRFQLSYGQIRQINFNVDDNVRFSTRYQANHDRTTASFFDLIELEWFDANITDSFRESIQQNTENDLLVELILNDYQPQFTSLSRYTFRNTATHPIRRDSGFFLEASVEVGGNLPYLVETLFISREDSLRGTIPSFSISGRELAYSQFIKTSFDYRRYYTIGSNSVFAWRGFAGIAYPYGLSKTIPINRRFFAGGTNDIRGWDPLTLGPGSNDRNINPINGGDIKLAGFMEFRNTFSRNFLSTNWILAAFADFGNVWLGPRNEIDEGKFSLETFWEEIALSSGIGLRLDWEFVILRLDLAYRINDLGNEPGTNILQRRMFHFGIGHSF